MWLLLGTAIVVVALDQLIKAWVVANLAGQPPLSLIQGFARLRYAENTGAAFGLFKGWSGLLSIAAVVIIVVIVLQASRVSASTPGMVSLGLITGGAIGNLVDRLRLGYVVDYFEVYGPSLSFNNVRYTFPLFNAADSAITVGAVLLMATLFFGMGSAESTKPPTPSSTSGVEPSGNTPTSHTPPSSSVSTERS